MRKRLRSGFGPGRALLALLVFAAWAPAGGPVADAAERGDVKAVQGLLKQGSDVNEPQGDGMTALHWAAERGDAELARLLISAGANVTAGTRIGEYTPLHLAAKSGQEAVALVLIEAGADVSAATSNSGVTPLHLAAEAGSSPIIQALVKHGADVNVREREWAQTPLIFAAAENRAEAIHTLIKLGADPSLTESIIDDVARRAAVDIAAQHKLYDVIAQFRPNWVNNDYTSDSWGPTDQGERPTATQLSVAIEAAREVQRKGEVLRTKDGEVQGVPAIATQFDVDEPAEVGKWGGLTPLLHAVRAGNTEATMALLDEGANINQKSGDGTTPLLIAMLNGRWDLGLKLLERGADPKVASDSNATPLYAVINLQWSGRSFYPQPRAQEQQKASHIQVMEALLKAGADPNVRLTKNIWWAHQRLVAVDLQGTTPFWRAALGLDVEAMRLLVANGADPSFPSLKPGRERRLGGSATNAAPATTKADPSGLPPVPDGGPAFYAIHAATGISYDDRGGNEHRHAPSGWMPAVKYLIEEMHVDVNARDAKGNTPLHNAASRGDNEMILYLVEHGADVMAVNRQGQTIADMANSPTYQVRPFPETIALLERLGSKNNHKCSLC